MTDEAEMNERGWKERKKKILALVSQKTSSEFMNAHLAPLRILGL